jgi:hypothetical protein
MPQDPLDRPNKIGITESRVEILDSPHGIRVDAVHQFVDWRGQQLVLGDHPTREDRTRERFRLGRTSVHGAFDQFSGFVSGIHEPHHRKERAMQIQEIDSRLALAAEIARLRERLREIHKAAQDGMDQQKAFRALVQVSTLASQALSE